jgi:hypothetical protein
VFFIPQDSHAQQQAAYQVPDSYTFDYEVIQQSKEDQKKKIDYYYTQNADYMGFQPDDDKKTFLIFTKDGVSVIIDNNKKTIMVLRMGNLIGDFAKAAGDMKKSNAMPKGDSSSGGNNKMLPVKTGNTKQISGYTAEEYKYTNSKGQTGSVWCAKVDFNASMFYMMGGMGMGSASPGRQPMGKSAQMQGLPVFNDPHLLLAEATSADHPGEGLTTQSITKKTTTITTKGYTINNMSNMGLKEMIEKASKQN